MEDYKISFIPPRRFLLFLYTEFFKSLDNQLLSSIYYSKIKPYSFQNYVAIRVLSKENPKFILADEVGLGKTIEAALILKELILKRGFKRILILVPPSLKEQWIDELDNNFNLDVEYRDTIESKVKILKSYKKNIPKIFLFTHFDIRFSEIKDAILDIKWDQVIVDEAHHIRRRGVSTRAKTTRLWTLMYHLSSRKNKPKSFLYLTATPMQLDPTEMFNLIRVLDENIFRDYTEFEQYSNRIQILREFSLFLSNTIQYSKKDDLLLDFNKKELYHYLEQLKDYFPQLSEYIQKLINKNNSIISITLLKKIFKKLSFYHKTNNILIRNRKKDLIFTFPEFKSRNIIDFKIEMSERFKAIYQALQYYVNIRARDIEEKKMYKIKKGYIKAIYEQLFTSSPWSLRKTLENRINTIINNIDEYTAYRELSTLIDNTQEIDRTIDKNILDEDVIKDDLSLIMKQLNSEDELDDLIDNEGSKLTSENISDYPGLTEREYIHTLLDKINLYGDFPKDDNKYLKLKDLIRSKLLEGINSFIIFVKYRETQKYIKKRLKEDFNNINFFKLNGSIPLDERKTIIRHFKNQKGILISTEVSGEGINLQFCNFLINYDLPWNPIKLEQRIGRIDRIGQEKIVFIRNFIYGDTISERKYERLKYRYTIHQQNIGELEPILKTNSELSQIIEDEDSKNKLIVKDLILRKNSYDKDFWDNLKILFPNYNETLIITYIYLFCKEFNEFFKIEKFFPEKYRNIYKIIFLNKNSLEIFENYRLSNNLRHRPDGPSYFKPEYPNFYLMTPLKERDFNFGYSYLFLDHPLIKFMINHITDLENNNIYYTTLDLDDRIVPPGHLLFYYIIGPNDYTRLIPIYISKEENFNDDFEDKLINFILRNPRRLFTENIIDTNIENKKEEILKLDKLCGERLDNLITKYQSIFKNYIKQFNLTNRNINDTKDFKKKLLFIAELKPIHEKHLSLEIVAKNFSFSQSLLSHQRLDFKIFTNNNLNGSKLYFEILINSEPIDFEFKNKSTKFIDIEKYEQEYNFSLVLPPLKKVKKTIIEFLLKGEYLTYQIKSQKLDIKYFRYSIFNIKNIQKKAFFEKEIIFIKTTSIFPIEKVKIVKLEKNSNEKIIFKEINRLYSIENPNYISQNGVACDNIFRIDEYLMPGLYFFKFGGEESDAIVILPNIEITIFNNPFDNLIIQPLNLTGICIEIKDPNNSELLNFINLSIYNKNYELYGRINNLSIDNNNSQIKLRFNKIFKLLDPPIEERLNFREFIFEFSYDDIILKKLKFKILPIISFNHIIGQNIIIRNKNTYELSFETNYEYNLSVYLELVNLEDKYLTFSKNKIPCEVDFNNRKIQINSNNILGGISYKINITLKCSLNEFLTSESIITIGNILFLKTFQVNINDSSLLLNFLNPLEENRKFLLENILDFSNEEETSNSDIKRLITQIFDKNTKIFKKSSIEEKLEFFSNSLDEFNHIFIITQYDFIFHPNLAYFISKFKNNKKNTLNINILTYPCPTESKIVSENDLKKIEKSNRRFFPSIRMRCSLCKCQNEFYLLYSKKSKKCVILCDNCNSISPNSLGLNLESYQKYIPISNYIQIHCHICNSPMICGTKNRETKVDFLCLKCGYRLKNVNINYNKYCLGNKTLSIISLNQLNYLLERNRLFPLNYTQLIHEIKQKIFNPDNLEEIYKFINLNFPDILNEKVNELNYYLNSKLEIEEINKRIKNLTQTFSQLKILNDRINRIKSKEVSYDKEAFFLKKIYNKIINTNIWNNLRKPFLKLRRKFNKSMSKDHKIIKDKKSEFSSLYNQILKTSIGKEFIILKDLNINTNLLKKDLKFLQKVIDGIKFSFFNSDYFKKMKDIQKLEKEIDNLREKWKKEIYLQVLKILNIKDNIDLDSEELSNFFELDDNIDVDFLLDEDINIPSFENGVEGEKCVLKVSSSLINFLKNQKLINKYLKPINYIDNLEKIKNISFEVNERDNNNYLPKLLFIFEDFSMDFKSNFSYDFLKFPSFLKNLKSELDALKISSGIQKIKHFTKLIFFLT